MLERLIGLSIRHRWLTLVLTAALVALGVWSYRHLSIDATPDITNVQVQINTQAPGYSPLEAEQRVTFAIETAMAGLPKLDYSRSLSRYGLSQVTVVFKDGTDLYFARQQVAERLQQIASQLPDGLDPEMGPISTGLGEIFMYTVEAEPNARKPDGTPYTATDLRTLQDWVIRPQLRTTPGVTEVNTIGGFERQIHITPDPAQLVALGFTLNDVVAAVMRNNQNIGAGYIERNGQQFLVRVPGQLANLDAIGNIVLDRRDGVPIRVRDVASVGEGKELRTGAATQNGHEVVVGTAFMLFGANSREVSQAAAAKLDAANASLPPGVHAKAVYDRTALVDRTIGTVSKNLIEGALLVVVVLFLLLGNVRAALDWCFAETGDRPLGVQLAAAAAPLFIEVSLLDECRRWTERALGAIEKTERGTRFEMELQAGLGHSLMLTSRNSEEAEAALQRGLEIATALGDRFNQVRLLNRLHLYYRRIGEIRRTLEAAKRMERVAGEIGDPVGRAAAHILLGVSHHLAGDQARARFHLDTCLAEAAGVRPTDPGHFAFYRPPRIPLSRILWLQGHPDQAVEMAGQIERTPLADDDPVTSCIGLIWGASVHGWAGDWTLVEQQAERLIAHATAHFLEPYRNVGLGMRGEALVQRGDVEEGTNLLRHAIASLEADRYWLYTPGFGATTAEALASTGQVEHAVQVIDGVIDAAETRGGLFILPELLRIKGEICARQADERQARSLFRRAFALAEGQSALSWQLRLAMSLMRLPGAHSQRSSARQLLADTYGRFTEGFATADLKAAKALLN